MNRIKEGCMDAWDIFVKAYTKNKGIGGGYLSVKDRQMFDEGFKAGVRFCVK